MKRRTCIVDHKYENTRSLRLLENVNKFRFIYQRLLVRCLNSRKPKSRDSESKILFQQLFEKYRTIRYRRNRTGVIGSFRKPSIRAT